ncbi:MAG: M50 family metallopeptidase [Verrucomicrobia bacterium]|nr:M50 family metallopeptidase [Verrucomicrobiota bacterium]
MPKWAKFIIAFLLLPVCFGALKTLWLVLKASESADTFWAIMLAGAACWVVIFYLLPKPMWVYVFGHELTHAVWTWLFGGRVKKFKANAKGGHVVVTKHNFLIALAPYFFPIYVALLVAIFAIGHLIWNWKPFEMWFHLLIGAAYAFHVTLTWHILKTRQSDITQQGYFFSSVIIFLGNIGVLIVGLPLLTAKVRLLTAMEWWFRSTADVLNRIGNLFS